MRLPKWIWVTTGAITLTLLTFVIRNNPQLIGMRPYKSPIWSTYRQFDDGKELRFRLYYPRESEETMLPTVVFLHGGGWYSGHVGQFYPFAKEFASRGYLAIVAEYRFTASKSELPFEAVSDVRMALRYLHEHADELKLDPERIVVAGASAGGHLALSTALSGISDQSIEPIDPHFKPDALMLLSGIIDTGPEGYGSPEIKENYVRLSPRHNLESGMPPTLLIFGSNDRHTSVAQAEQFAEANLALGNRVQLRIFPDGDHGFFEPGQEVGAFEQVIDWQIGFLNEIGMGVGSNSK